MNPRLDPGRKTPSSVKKGVLHFWGGGGRASPHRGALPVKTGDNKGKSGCRMREPLSGSLREKNPRDSISFLKSLSSLGGDRGGGVGSIRSRGKRKGSELTTKS